MQHLAILSLLCTVGVTSAQHPPGHHSKVPVQAPTRIDWTFAVSNQSLAKIPDTWLGGYDSTKQSFGLYVPPRATPKAPVGLVLFVSPSNAPMGAKLFEPVCKKRGLLFAALRGAGNNVDPKQRVRIALDVLDQLRRSYPIDPDRTYIAGFSGGGRIACALAFALPEYFGGVIPICASGDLRTEPWLRHRVIDRLGLALVTGETDFNRGEVERFRGPYLKEVGVTTRVWVQPKLGHGMPNAKTVDATIDWLDSGVVARRTLTKEYPATRIGPDSSPTRSQRATALFDEGKSRLEERKTQFSGLMMIQGVMKRYPDLKQSKEARDLLLDYESKKEKPWESDDIAEQRKFLAARARALTNYAKGELPNQYAKMRPDMAKAALSMWKQLRADSPKTFETEASRSIDELERLLDK